MVGLARRLTPAFAPGTGWLYSNSNDVLLGLIIEAVASRTSPPLYD